MFSNIDWSDIAERALWTFVQAFVGALAIGSITDFTSLRFAVVAGVGAGLSALISFGKNVVRQRVLAE